MPAGRPTHCTEDIIAQAWEYISSDNNKNYESHGHAIPSVVGMCKIINRARSTVYQWAEEEGNGFTDILEACKELQEFATINGTLKGDLNANIGKLILGKHGYHEKQDRSHYGAVGMIDLTGKTDEELKAIIKGEG